MDGTLFGFLLVTLVVLSGVAMLLMAMYGRSRIRELAYRERIAMIERGLIPSPGAPSPPGPFEPTRPHLRASDRAVRTRSVGVILIGLGMGLIMLFSFAAGLPSVGLGVGGAFALLGAAFVANAMLSSRDEPEPPSFRSASDEPPRSAPPLA